MSIGWTQANATEDHATNGRPRVDEIDGVSDHDERIEVVDQDLSESDLSGLEMDIDDDGDSALALYPIDEEE